MTSQKEDRVKRLKWFKEARFGMFVHWGLYSLIGRHEWVMNTEHMSVEEYTKLGPKWHPRPGAAREWARLAKHAGMRYMVMTTKHHDGFCLFDSEISDFNAVKYGPKRDLVAEYVEAARDEGLKVGLYYSPMDWRHPDGESSAKNAKARKRFVKWTHGLIRELMTHYGRIDIMWYDTIWPLDAEGLESKKLNAMVRELQPGIIINNRSGLEEDFGTPEQEVTADPSGRMWESCMTMNDAWGYTPIDTNYKSTFDVLRMLQQVARGGGNLLLNVGPSSAGDIPYECTSVFSQVGQWLRKYGPTIYEATDPVEGGHMVCGNYTRKKNTLYFHCDCWPGSVLNLNFVPGKIKNVKLYGGAKLRFKEETVVRRNMRLPRATISGMPELPPDSLCTVIEIELDAYKPRNAK